MTDRPTDSGAPGEPPPDPGTPPGGTPWGPWERRDFWRHQQREIRRQPHNRRCGLPADSAARPGHHGAAGPPWTGGRPPWAPGAAPWGDGPRPGPGWVLRRVAPIVIGLVLVVAFTTAVAGWVLASVLGLIGPDIGSAGPVILLARLLGVGVVVVGIVSISRRVRRLGGPIAELADATRRIEAGDYTVRVDEPNRGVPELLELTRGFNTMAARLEADERQRRSLLADVSHELRTPLAVVQGNVEALVDGVHPPDAAHLGAILDETRVLGRLIDDLRTLTLVEAGTLPLHREPTDVALLAADVTRSFEPVATAAGTSVALDAGDAAVDALAPLDVDPIRIREVLSNLVANALRYSPPGGTVLIGLYVEPSGDRLRVEVHDDGPGLPPDLAEHVFERFTRGPGSSGSGLGLAIARNLVLAHGGEIGLASPPGGGTTAWFRLPLPPATRG